MNELILSITIEPLEEGGYLATSDDLGLIAKADDRRDDRNRPGCSAQADRIIRGTWRPLTPPERGICCKVVPNG